MHGVDVEGMKLGIDERLVEQLGKWSPIPVTYAGGARSVEDLEKVRVAGARAGGAGWGDGQPAGVAWPECWAGRQESDRAARLRNAVGRAVRALGLAMTMKPTPCPRHVRAGKGRVDVTVGSALDIFGGALPYKDVVEWHKKQLA